MYYNNDVNSYNSIFFGKEFKMIEKFFLFLRKIIDKVALKNIKKMRCTENDKRN